jgi:PleD family two-component response regulator
MKKLRSAVELVGARALYLVLGAVVAVILSPISPVPLLGVAILTLGGTLVLLVQRSLPHATNLQTLTVALDDRNQQVQQLSMELQELSLIDPLTGARNRRGFINLVEHQLRVATRSWSKVHFLFVDIDG